MTTGSNEELVVEDPKWIGRDMPGKPYCRSELLDRIAEALANHHSNASAAQRVRFQCCRGIIHQFGRCGVGDATGGASVTGGRAGAASLLRRTPVRGTGSGVFRSLVTAGAATEAGVGVGVTAGI